MEPLQSVDAAARFASETQGTRPLDNVEISQYYIDIKRGMKIPYPEVISATEVTDTSLPKAVQEAKASAYCMDFNKYSGKAVNGVVNTVELTSKPSVFLCVQAHNS